MREYGADAAAQGCTGALLCGGESRRMGFDKAFLYKDGRPLLLHHYQKLLQLFGRAVPVCGQKAKFARDAFLAPLPFVEDHYPGAGPLGGICTALEVAGTPWIFLMACDMADPNFELLPVLQAQLPGAQVVLCTHGQRWEPVFAFYHRSCLPVFTRQLLGGRLRIREGFSQLEVRCVAVDEALASDAFANLNTPQDLARWGLEAPPALGNS